MTNGPTQEDRLSPYVEIDRSDWAALAGSSPVELEESEISELRSLGDYLDWPEVSEVYLPLSALLSLYAANTQSLYHETNRFLGQNWPRTPFVIGIAGSVAVGKSTVARLMATLLSRWPDTPSVELITTDGFLLPNATLEERGLMGRKGFPESYDRRALLKFISQVKSGASEIHAPVYSHVSYDIVPGQTVAVRQPDILIVEGLNVLQPPLREHGLAVSDLFDFTIYVDARMKDIERWYEERFLALQRGAFNQENSYFHRYAELSEAEARVTALDIWHRINEPNLLQNILPTRSRASLVLRKGSDHTVQKVLLRKL